MLAVPPLYSTLRVNTLARNTQDVCDLIQQHFKEVKYALKILFEVFALHCSNFLHSYDKLFLYLQKFQVTRHAVVDDVLVIEGTGPYQVSEVNYIGHELNVNSGYLEL